MTRTEKNIAKIHDGLRRRSAACPGPISIGTIEAEIGRAVGIDKRTRESYVRALAERKLIVLEKDGRFSVAGTKKEAK